MKILTTLILSLAIICFPIHEAFAVFSFDQLFALEELKQNIVEMAYLINAASSKMMKFAHMLLCYANHGEASYGEFSVAGIVSVNVHFVEPETWLSGAIFYVLGFFILMMASFYMFDVSFNLSIALVVLPIGLALWPFGWTRDKLRPMIESIAYYTGIFIFLPLGIVLAANLIKGVADEAISSGGGFNFDQAFAEGKADLIKDNLGITSTGFLKLLICYILAMRIIPMMAGEFCQHFFGGSLVGTPIGDKLNEMVAATKEKTIGRAWKLGKDITKHQTGLMIRNQGDKNGSFRQRALYRYGDNIAKSTRRKKK